MSSMLLPLLLSLSAGQLSAEPPSRPHLIATVRISPLTAYPDVLSASATLHAIPHFDLEVGTSYAVLFGTVYVRGGPRFLIKDWRDLDHRGWTLRLAGLGGYKGFLGGFMGYNVGHSVNLVGTVDATRWFSPHFGVSLQAAAGAVISWPTAQAVPDVRLSVGLSF